MRSIILEIENIAESLNALDSDKKDRTITQKEFTNLQNTSGMKAILGILTGTESIANWVEFKRLFITYQSDHGFEWVIGPGQGGPISLDEINLPADVGKELANQQFNKGVEEGNFEELLKENFKNLASYLDKDWSIISWQEVRAAFKEATFKNQSYKFSPGRSSLEYKMASKEYKFKAKNPRQAEYEFGELIYKKLKDVLKLDILIHCQSKRNSGKYRNFDFEGIKIKKHISGDEFLMYSFELKPSNTIEYISQAISQAVNYHSHSNFTYIIIPLFDRITFFDQDRIEDMLNMCKINKLGVLSVNMNLEAHTLIDIDEVIEAPKTELEDSDKLMDLIKDSDWEMCPLCKKIVDKYKRKRCGWIVSSEDKSECMKILLENNMLINLNK